MARGEIKGFNGKPVNRFVDPPHWIKEGDRKRRGTKGEDDVWVKGVTPGMRITAAEGGYCPVCKGRHDVYRCHKLQKDFRYPEEYFFYSKK